jgi:Tol biopolymer transport system component
MRAVFLFILIVLSSNAMDFQTAYDKAREHEAKSEWVKALAIYKKLSAKRPQIFQLYNRMAKCFLKLKYPDLAERYFRKTLEYSPQDKEAVDGLAELFLKEEPTPEELKSNEALQISQDLTRMQNMVSSRRRLYYIRDQKLYTMQMDGRDLRVFADIKMGLVYPGQSDGGFSATYYKEQTEIYLFKFKTGEFFPVTMSSYNEFSPVYREEEDSVYFLRELENQHVLYKVKALENQNEERVLQDFFHIAELKYDSRSRTLFFWGRKDETWAYNKIFRWNFKDEPEQISFGVGNDSEPQMSPDGTKILCIRENLTGTYNFILVNLTNKNSEQITFFNSDELSASWAATDRTIYFSVSKADDRLGWETRLGKIDVETKLITELKKSNFVNRDLLFDDKTSSLYYLGNYDNNFEVYRLNLNNLEIERLTMTPGDEVRLGFWTYSEF